MLIPIADQRQGVEIHLIGSRSPYTGIKHFPDAMEVGQAYDTRFYDCPAGEPVGVVCVDGVWHWEVETTSTEPASV